MSVTSDTIGCITSRAIKKNAAASGKEGKKLRCRPAAVDGKNWGAGERRVCGAEARAGCLALA